MIFFVFILSGLLNNILICQFIQKKNLPYKLKYLFLISDIERPLMEEVDSKGMFLFKIFLHIDVIFLFKLENKILSIGNISLSLWVYLRRKQNFTCWVIFEIWHNIPLNIVKHFPIGYLLYLLFICYIVLCLVLFSLFFFRGFSRIFCSILFYFTLFWMKLGHIMC